MNIKLLSDKLTSWRAERPDEWTMDRFIHDAKQLEAAYAEQIESNRLLMENNEKLRAKCKTMLSDSCETDDDVRKTARGVITDFEIDGDDHGVPVVEDIVESLAKKIKELESERDALQAENAELTKSLCELADLVVKREDEHKQYRDNIAVLRNMKTALSRKVNKLEEEKEALQAENAELMKMR